MANLIATVSFTVGHSNACQAAFPYFMCIAEVLTSYVVSMEAFVQLLKHQSDDKTDFTDVILERGGRGGPAGGFGG